MCNYFAMQFIFASMLNKSHHKLESILDGMKPNNALCITTAANVYAEQNRQWQQDEMEVVRQLGFVLDAFDIENKSPAEIEAKLDQHDVVYITGGNTYFLLEQMQRSGFKTKIHEWVRNRGKMYIGCSAGAVVACPRIDYIGDMDDIKLSTLSDFEGLNFFDKLIMVHADHPKYGPKAEKLMHEWNKTSHPFVPLKDDQLLVWNDKEEAVL